MPNILDFWEKIRQFVRGYPTSRKSMKNIKGFSLTEVLIALLLVSCTSLTLVQQQLSSNVQCHQIIMHAKDLLDEENNAEEVP